MSLLLLRIIESDVCGEAGCYSLSISIAMAATLFVCILLLISRARIHIRKQAIKDYIKEGGDESDEFVVAMKRQIAELKGEEFE